MVLPTLQHALVAYPILTICAALIVGILVFLAIRILFHSLGCLVHVGCAVLIAVAIFIVIRAIVLR